MSADEPLAYLTDRFLPQREARLPVHDAGVVFGATITDLSRTFHHCLFRLADHLARFRHGCRYAHIPLPQSDGELTDLAEELIAHNARLLRPDDDLALVLFATPGPIGYYAGQPTAQDGPPTLCLHTFPLPFARYAGLFREGARLIVPATRHVPAVCVEPRVKQRSRLHWWLANQEVRQADPDASALLLDLDGHVTETAFANFLIVRQGAVRSPPRTSVLDGISLRVTEELCRELGIPFAEAPLTVADCQTADEALLTGTAFCLAGVRSINGAILPWPGPVTEALAVAWVRSVGLDYRAQILRT
jgi:branched-chain amino acid aminotransferase